MICGGAVSRRNLAYLALEALAAERDLSVIVNQGRTPAAGGLGSIDSSRDAAIGNLGLVVYRRPARPLHPGLPRQMLQQSSEMRRAAWAQAWAQSSRRGLPAVRATCQRLLDSQGHPAGILIIYPSEWLAIIDRDEQQVIRAIAPAVLPRPLSDSTWHELRRPWP